MSETFTETRSRPCAKARWGPGSWSRPATAGSSTRSRRRARSPSTLPPRASSPRARSCKPVAEGHGTGFGVTTPRGEVESETLDALRVVGRAAAGEGTGRAGGLPRVRARHWRIRLPRPRPAATRPRRARSRRSSPALARHRTPPPSAEPRPARLRRARQHWWGPTRLPRALRPVPVPRENRHEEKVRRGWLPGRLELCSGSSGLDGHVPVPVVRSSVMAAPTKTSTRVTRTTPTWSATTAAVGGQDEPGRTGWSVGAIDRELARSTSGETTLMVGARPWRLPLAPPPLELIPSGPRKLATRPGSAEAEDELRVVGHLDARQDCHKSAWLTQTRRRL